MQLAKFGEADIRRGAPSVYSGLEPAPRHFLLNVCFADFAAGRDPMGNSLFMSVTQQKLTRKLSQIFKEADFGCPELEHGI